LPMELKWLILPRERLLEAHGRTWKQATNLLILRSSRVIKLGRLNPFRLKFLLRII
jgi:hypothetical protein